MFPSAVFAAYASAGIRPVQLILRVAPYVRAPGLVHKQRWPHLGLAMYAFTKHMHCIAIEHNHQHCTSVVMPLCNDQGAQFMMQP